ncbi:MULTISPECIES: restriction endonuclease subunit S [Bacteria]
MSNEGWTDGTVADAVTRIRAGFSASGNDRPAREGELGVLKTGAVLGSRFRAQEHKAVTDKPELLRVPVRRNTVLLGRKNSAEMVGAAVHIDSDHPSLYLSDLIWELTPALDVSSHWLAYALQSDHMRQRIRLSASGTQSTMKNLNREVFLSLPLRFPSLPEQRRIADILRAWDSAIAAVERLIVSAQSRYAVTVNVLAGVRSDSHRLGDATHELTARNATDRFERSDVMGVSNKNGIVPMRAQTIALDLSRYQILPPRSFAYNPMRIDVGSIAMSRLDRDVIVSPDYVLFACDADLLPEYLDHVLETQRWRHDVGAGASGSVRTRTYYDDLAAIRIHLPGIDEQRRIAGALDAMRDEVALLDRKVALLREQKRGLAQKLLSGEIRVTAEAPDD